MGYRSRVISLKAIYSCGKLATAICCAAAPASTAPADAPTSAPESSAPDSSPPAADPPADVTDEEFLALVDELQRYVAEARGLEFLSDVVVELEDDDAFEQRLLEDFEEDIDELAQVEVLYRALGLLETEETLVEVLRDVLAAGVLGFYDPETDELVVRGTGTTPYVRQTIVHELVHALDDQHFDLDRPEYDERDDEIELGFSAVIEGDARRIEEQWLGEQSADVRAQAAEEERAFVEGVDFSSFPEILLFQIQAPYEFGQIFVGQLLLGAGERSVDAALTDPPDTSEQILFPDRYSEREPRIEVPAPPADGELVDEGVLGALFLFSLLSLSDSTVNQSDAVRAIDGWGGDWAVTWTDGDANCMRADIVGDDDGDTDEIEDALDSWVDGREIGNVSRTDDGRVRLESCALAAGAVPPQV